MSHLADLGRQHQLSEVRGKFLYRWELMAWGPFWPGSCPIFLWVLFFCATVQQKTRAFCEFFEIPQDV